MAVFARVLGSPHVWGITKDFDKEMPHSTCYCAPSVMFERPNYTLWVRWAEKPILELCSHKAN